MPDTSAKKKNLITSFELDKSTLIEASAGTGKTYTITYLVLRLLLGSFETRNQKGDVTGNEVFTIENLLVVTFTNAAASDLVTRIREQIRKVRLIFNDIAGELRQKDFSYQERLKNGDYEEETAFLIKQVAGYGAPDNPALSFETARSLLLTAERNIDNAAICTIHSFCYKALNQIYAFEAGQPFDVKLKDKVKDELDEAAYAVWRSLFYREDGTGRDASVRNFILNALGTNTPNFLNSDFYHMLFTGRCASPADCFDGYDLQALPKTEEKIGKGCAEDIFAPRNGDPASLEKYIFDYAKACSERFSDHTAAVSALSCAADFLRDFGPLSDFMSENPDGTFSPQSVYIAPKKGALEFPADLTEVLARFNQACIMVRGHEGEPDKICDGFDLSVPELPACFGKKGQGLKPKFGDIFKTKDKSNQAYIDGFYDALVRFYGILAERAKNQNSLHTDLGLRFRLLIGVLTMLRLDEICERGRVIGFNGVLWKLNHALLNDRDGSLRRMLRLRYPVAMIDEFQDTDPLQFSIFGSIYLTPEAKKDKAVCYLIGDPKQSIYAFRGADINSYIGAGAKVTEQGGKHETLEANYRSAPALVRGLNELFSHDLMESAKPRHDDFFGLEKVPFNPVKVGLKESLSFCFEDEFIPKRAEDLPPAVKLFYLDTKETSELKLGLPGFRLQQAELCAQTIKRVLEKGILYTPGSGEEPRRVEKHDIAVLVASNSEFGMISGALERAGLSAVYLSDRESVLSTPETGDILTFMQALSRPADRKALTALLSSRLMGLSGDGLKLAMGEDKLTLLIENLRECAAVWTSKGLLPAFELFVSRGENPPLKRMFAFEDGERLITNYRHLCELIQNSHQKVRGFEAQVRWFKELLEDPGQLSSELVTKRLESETEQVRVFTHHVSKGLEFKLVFLPFAVNVPGSLKKSKDRLEVYYRADHNHYAINVDDTNDDIRGPADAREKKRLHYVALTRAKCAEFIFASRIVLKGSDNTISPTCRLLGFHSGKDEEDFYQKNLDLIETDADPGLDAAYPSCHKQLFDCRLFAVSPAGGVTALSRYDYKSLMARNGGEELRVRIAEQTAAPLKFSVSKLDKGDIKSGFGISSYSSITKGLHDDPSLKDSEADEPEEKALNEDGTEQKPSSKDGIGPCFSFPRGTDPGTFLHELLEKCHFHEINTNDKCLSDRVAEYLTDERNAGLGKWLEKEKQKAGEKVTYDIKSRRRNALIQWLSDITGAKIRDPEGRSFSLRDLEEGRYIPEMDFMLPLAEFKTGELNELCIRNYRALFGDTPAAKELISKWKLTAGTLSGFLKGSLDLVCAVGDDRKRYYVIDYKSTHLGDDYSCYSPDKVRQNVFSPRTRYDVQFLIYAAALHRYLGMRLSDYDYDRDFGGVIYLYLRGLKSGDEAGSGIFCEKPEKSLV